MSSSSSFDSTRTQVLPPNMYYLKFCGRRVQANELKVSVIDMSESGQKSMAEADCSCVCWRFGSDFAATLPCSGSQIDSLYKAGAEPESNHRQKTTRYEWETKHKPKFVEVDGFLI